MSGVEAEPRVRFRDKLLSELSQPVDSITSLCFGGTLYCAHVSMHFILDIVLQCA